MSGNKEALATIQEAEKNGSNLIMLCNPHQLPELHRLVVETVQFNISTEAGDVYYHKTSKKWMIHNQGLMKLALAAAIEWDVEGTRPRVVERDFVHFAAVGCIKKEYGKPVCFRGDYDFDLESERDNLLKEYSQKAKEYKKDKNWVNDCVDRDYRFKRKHKLKLSASGAKAVVVNKLLGLKSGYSKEEIGRPFVVVRCVVAPDLSDPDTQRRLNELAIQAVAGVFGPRPVMPTLPVPNGDPVGDVINIPTVNDPEPKPELDPSPEDKPYDPDEFFIPKDLEDFKARNLPQQVEALELLAERKRYDLSGLPCAIKDMNERNRCRFFEHLSSLPNVSPEDDIPF